MKLKAGDQFPEVKLNNIHGAQMMLPDTKSKWVHLQFRRFAGCPICNLHLQEFIRRDAELKTAGIHEIVLFHSPKESLLPHQGAFPFDVVGDPKKELYHRFGVGASPLSILNPKVWPTMFKAAVAKNKPKGAPEGGPLGLPADILIASNGKVVASHYGSHASDQWSVDELLDLTKR